MGLQSRRSRRWQSAMWRGALGALAIVGALALGMTWAVAPAHAAGGCGTTQACIHWSSDMIYAGQNNGFPEGPVGEHAAVTGEGFTPSEQISLRLAQGDVNNPSGGGSAYEFCKLATPRVDGVATGITVDSSGNFSASFDWPAAAGSGLWSVCAIDNASGFPAPLGAGSIDDGPFSVLSSHAPSLALSSATVNPGGSVTVTGHHWLPGQGQIFVYAGPCADCGGTPLAFATVSSNSSGVFTATLSFAGTAAPGSYIVSAHTQNGVLDTITSGPHITVALAPTATPLPTATATAAPTATTASGGGSSSSSSSGGSSSGSSGWLIPMLLGAGGVLALLLLGAAYLLPGWPPPTHHAARPTRRAALRARRWPGLHAHSPPTYTPAGPNDATQIDLPPIRG